MAKRTGRKRKPAERRQPNGRPASSRPVVREAATATVKAQRMARGATADNYQDQAHESPLGRLYISGRLGRGDTATDRYQSGQWFNGLYHAHRRAIEARKPFASLPSPGRANDLPDDVLARAVAAYSAAIKAVPVLSRSTLMDVVICQGDPSPGGIVALLPALDAITAHRLLTPGPNRNRVPH